MYSQNSSAITSATSMTTRPDARTHQESRSSGPSLLIAGLAALLGLAGCGGVDDDTPQGVLVIPEIEWQLVFEDEFDGDSLDTSKWNIQTGDGCPDLCGWGNNEQQIYSEDNITVSGGFLTIEGRQEADDTYTSARINTKGKFDFRYGKVEVSARLPAGQGVWPAIWLLHSDAAVYGPWPLSGEIDIMEAFNLGVNGNTATQSTTHYGLDAPPYTGTSSKYDTGVSPDMAFHEYTMEWERDKIRFYVDGVHFQTQNAQNWYVYYPADEDGLYNEFGAYDIGPRDSPFDQLFHLIINFAIGGNPVGDPDPGAFPQFFEIDYVRVYECANANPDTGRGCGTADPDVVPLKDNDGSPIQDRETAQPYLESLPLYLDGPETLELTVGEQTSTNTLEVSGFTGEGASVINDPAFPDPDDANNIVWHVAVSGGVANAYLTSQELTDDPLLDTGFDFSGNRLGGEGEDPVGEVAFDMQVNEITEGTRLLIKLDSGFPNLGEIALPASELLVGDWKTYSVKFDMFLENPGFIDLGGTGVDLKNVLNPFVIEVQDGSADVYLDNIRVTNACKVVGGCGADLKTKGLPDVVVYDDAVNFDVWTRGIVASDSGTGFNDYTDPGNPANKVNWVEIASDEPERGQVIEVTFNDSDAFGVWFIGSDGGTDLSAYNAGAVQFDLKVLDYGDNTTGMTFKIDCFFPCGSGDERLGFIADGVWETVTFPVSRLLDAPAPPATGLDLTAVNTGIVLFPTTQQGDITFQVDNIRWIAEAGSVPLQQIDLPVTFDDALVDYTLGDFEGAVTVLGDDPTGANNTVAVTTKTAGAQTFAGTVIGTDAGFANPIPFTPTETLMSVRVYSPAAGIPVLLKVENVDDGSLSSEVIANTTVANAWETLIFDFGSVGIDTSIEYGKAIIFFDFGQSGNDAIYYWDDVLFGSSLQQIDLPVTFDDPTVDYTLIDFGGAATVVGDDPAAAGNTVAATTKTAGSEVWAGTVIGTDSGFATPIPFTPTETTMSVRVFSPATDIPVLLKVENLADPNLFAEVSVNTTVANAWETLIFDFATVGIDTSIEYAKAAIFFDFGTSGNDATYYWDDVAFGAGVLQQIDLPVTFDDPLVDYTVSDFNGAVTAVGADPTGAANNVGVTTKTSGAATFAGTVIGKDFGGFANPIPFTATETVMSVRVYSPAAGIPVRLKVENAADANLFAELDVNTTVANAWEPLNFDFATVGIDTSIEYSKAIIFFDFGQPGNDATYYWDDLQFGMQLRQIDLPVTFDDPLVDYTVSDFNGAVTVVGADPTGGGNNVGVTTKTDGAATFAGTVIGKDFGGFANPIPFTATETVMSVRVYSPAAGIPVRLKVENAADGNLFAELDVNTTVANAWETLNFDFATVGIDTSIEYGKAVIFFDFGQAGNGATYYWDDLQFGAGGP